MYNDVTPRRRQEPQPSPGQYASAAPQPSPASAPPQKPKKRENWRSVLTTIGILLLAPLFALLLTAYVFQTYQVDGPSMQNTLEPNDRLIVWKVPRTWARITGNPYIPARGDIVIFNEPDVSQFGQSGNKQLIKRVVALPGERVTSQNGALTVHNQEHPEGFQPELAPSIREDHTGEMLDVTVPEDHIFVAGDNRANSLDSRSFGPVHVDNIVGKLAVRILPLDEAQWF
jgi:signal peptidase I